MKLVDVTRRYDRTFSVCNGKTRIGRITICLYPQKKIGVVHYQLMDEYQGKGLGWKAHLMGEAFINSLGYKCIPAPLLSKKAYRMWKKNAPTRIKGRPVRPEGSSFDQKTYVRLGGY